MTRSTDQSDQLMESVQLALTNEDIQACFPVMVQLRPHLITEKSATAETADPEKIFIDRIRRQMNQGYQLAFIAAADRVVAVAGFRILENLAWGKFLYVDDLVTDTSDRSRGYGQLLLEWLVEYGRSHHCKQFHLDSGVQRYEAHRFYFRQRLSITSYHFALSLR
ncbi:GNAT family N-acetyltransferase [Leptolyngbya ohadii]|uniref:GNAT family N-acetyltransferase n=1 Tax=Leptolyngbya ohadii TaxID=1962290 RepID=UPI001CED090C|nr:GNAT family N-acetyltransferase [Leptolyngbya ohadii]